MMDYLLIAGIIINNLLNPINLFLTCMFIKIMMHLQTLLNIFIFFTHQQHSIKIWLSKKFLF
jgi:hypothetical protein